MDGHAVAKLVLLEPGGGLELPMGVGADRITFKATGEDTGGMLTFLEYWAEPGSRGTTVHIHDGHGLKRLAAAGHSLHGVQLQREVCGGIEALVGLVRKGRGQPGADRR